jgi:tetratricopeptide (TPR) repeat protein
MLYSLPNLSGFCRRLQITVSHNRRLSLASAWKTEAPQNPTTPYGQSRSTRPRELDSAYTLVQRGQFQEALGELIINDKSTSQHRSIWAYLLRGISYEGLSDTPKALHAYEMACLAAGKYSHVDPCLLIECLRRYCQTLHTMGSYDALLECKRRLVNLLRIVSRNDPTQYQLALAEELAGLATTHALYGDVGDGLRAAEEAEELLNRIGLSTSISSPLLLWLKVMDTRAILHWALDEYEEAIRCNEKATEKYREIIEKGRKDGTMDPQIEERYAIALGRFADQLRQMQNQASDVLSLYRRALAVWLFLLKTSPQTRRYAENLQMATLAYSAIEPDEEASAVLKEALDAIPGSFQDVRVALLLVLSDISAEKPLAGEPEARCALHILDEWTGVADSLPLKLRLAAATALTNSLRRLDRNEEAVESMKNTEEKVEAILTANPTLADKPLLQDLAEFTTLSSR